MTSSLPARILRRFLEDSSRDDNGGNDDDGNGDDSSGSYFYSDVFSFFANMTDFNDASDFDSQLVPAEDVPVSAVLSSLVFNSIAFLLLMASYECLRRVLPTVYSSKKRLDRIRQTDSENLASTPPTTSHYTGQHRAGATSDQRRDGGSGDDEEGTTPGGRGSTPYQAFPYDPRQRETYFSHQQDNHDTNAAANANSNQVPGSSTDSSNLLPLPDDRPLDWVFPVFGVPWKQVRKIAGLDGYFFLRYIRMNVRITAVSTFWFFAILVPIYATGGGPHDQYYYQVHGYNNNENGNNNGNNENGNNNNNNGGGGNRQMKEGSGESSAAYEQFVASPTATGWYYFSAANLPIGSWRIWVPVLFCYLFSAFIIFVIKQEYRHFLELRQDFLARGTAHVNPQHHYSLMVENVPYELRSDRALKEYFEKLFPGRVHSASVVLKLPDLEELSARCMRTCRRLEKSIAYWHATGKRPTHIVGRGRLRVLGVDLAPWDCNGCNPCTDEEDAVYIEDGRYVERPERGTRVDSISYYTQELAADSRALFKMQKRKAQIADSGNMSFKADNWLNQVVMGLTCAADAIIEDSLINNDLLPSEDDADLFDAISPRSLMAETMTSQYGSFPALSPTAVVSPATNADKKAFFGKREEDDGVLHEDDPDSRGLHAVQSCPTDEREKEYKTPFAGDQYKSKLRRWAGRLGLDFVVAVIKATNRQLDVALEGVIGATMSSTGFVSFLDLSSTTCAASAPLTVKATVLEANVAPEPREIMWNNVHVSKQTSENRELIANMVLVIGGIFWSFPLAAIQAFAKAKYLAQIPGMEWIETFHGGVVSSFVNGYLPVLALLGLILILPVIFQYIATHYEHRKTFSDIQASMLGRYFYYQLVTIYVTVTAGSLLKSLANIIDHPSSLFELLGESLPSMVGYFVALLVTKIMAGLPMIFLRFGALSRMLLLRLMTSSEAKLTQRELDSVYRLENVQYGWEFPTQLLVVVIVFTYAVICPTILPVGFIYFLGALIVYKKQVLYVYSPVYESGGRFFPLAVQRTLFGLICSQLTLMGYLMTRGCRVQPLFLAPLPMMTTWAMGWFHTNYAVPSQRLSLERAREYDRLCALQERNNNINSTTPTAGTANAAGNLTPAISPLGSPTTMITEDDMESALETRKREFDFSAYRQPVLTELAAEPMTYRRGVEDEETCEIRDQLRRVNRYNVAPGGGAYPLSSNAIGRAPSLDRGALDGFQSPII